MHLNYSQTMLFGISSSLFLILHGGIIFFLGLLGGFPYARAIVKRSDRETAWRVFHTGNCMGGIWMMAMGATLPALNPEQLLENSLVLFAVLSCYAFSIGMYLAARSGHRGLDRSLGGADRVVSIFYAIGAIASLFAGALFIWICVVRI